MQVMVNGKDIQKLLGSEIRDLRLSKNMSQEKLAEAAQLDRSYISDIERGEKAASVITVFKISLALELKPSELFERLEQHITFNE